METDREEIVCKDHNVNMGTKDETIQELSALEISKAIRELNEKLSKNSLDNNLELTLEKLKDRPEFKDLVSKILNSRFNKGLVFDFVDERLLRIAFHFIFYGVLTLGTYDIINYLLT